MANVVSTSFVRCFSFCMKNKTKTVNFTINRLVNEGSSLVRTCQNSAEICVMLHISSMCVCYDNDNGYILSIHDYAMKICILCHANENSMFVHHQQR